MKDFVIELDSGIYRVTSEGKVYTQSKMKIPLVSKGMEFTGEFKHILKPEKLLATSINNRGYNTVRFANTTHMIHRLVAKGFVENPEDKPFVNHKDGNKLNNYYSNLEWCTAAENNKHARDTGLHIQAKGHKINYKSEASKAKALANLKDKTVLTKAQVIYCRKVNVPRSKEYSATALAERFGVSVTAMCNAIKGKTFIHIK